MSACNHSTQETETGFPGQVELVRQVKPVSFGFSKKHFLRKQSGKQSSSTSDSGLLYTRIHVYPHTCSHTTASTHVHTHNHVYIHGKQGRKKRMRGRGQTDKAEWLGHL